jgi:ribosome-binding factor A
MPTYSQAGAKRKPRLASLLEHSLAEYFKTELELPGLVSIAQVEVAANMQFATVWLSVYGASEEDVLEILRHAAGDLRQHLTKRLSSRYIPQLQFKIDPSEAHAQKITETLNDLNE